MKKVLLLSVSFLSALLISSCGSAPGVGSAVSGATGLPGTGGSSSGSASGVAGSCTVSSGTTYAICTEYSGGYTASSVQSGCSGSGTYNSSGCSTSGMIGKCAVSSSGYTTTSYYGSAYSSSGSSLCSSGTWTLLSGSTGGTTGSTGSTGSTGTSGNAGGGAASTGSTTASAGSTVTTIAGSALVPGFTDGTGSAARFADPWGITSDGPNLYVTDHMGYAIRKVVISTGVVTTLAGKGGVYGNTDGAGSAARFSNPHGITTDGTNLYVVDECAIRKVVISTAAVTTLAGNVLLCDYVDGTGSAARFKNPQGITNDGTNLFVTDTLSNTIRKVVISTGTVTTLAGNASVTYGGSADGTGSAALFSQPTGIATDGTNLFVADSGNDTIRKVVISTKAVTTLAGNTGGGMLDGTGTAATFSWPTGIAIDSANVYVVDHLNNTIRKVVISTGVVTTLAGNPNIPNGYADGTGSAALFLSPVGIATDGTNLYVTESSSTIRKLTK